MIKGFTDDGELKDVLVTEDGELKVKMHESAEAQETVVVNDNAHAIPVNVQNPSTTIANTSSNAVPVEIQNANIGINNDNAHAIPVNVQNPSTTIANTSSNAVPVEIQNANIGINNDNAHAIPVNVQNPNVSITNEEITEETTLLTRKTNQTYTTIAINAQKVTEIDVANRSTTTIALVSYEYQKNNTTIQKTLTVYENEAVTFPINRQIDSITIQGPGILVVVKGVE